MQAAVFLAASSSSLLNSLLPAQRHSRTRHDHGKRSLRQATVAATTSPRSSPVLENQQRQQKQQQVMIDEQRNRHQEQQHQLKKTLVGFESFIRSNPRTDRFKVHGFHHIELWCGDATNTWRRFSWGLGMNLVAKSDQTTGNQTYCSYVLQSEDLVMVFSAPYSDKIDKPLNSRRSLPHPGLTKQQMSSFFDSHGLGVRAVGIRVENARQAFEISVANGAIAVLEPQVLTDSVTDQKLVVSEVLLYGDVVLRFVSGGAAEDGGEDFQGPFLPNYEPVEIPRSDAGIGLQRLDHAVGNVEKLLEATSYISGFTGFHEFAEFTAEDIGTAESGLNSMVLASDNEMVLLPINEPVHGTKRKSQIQTYLDHNEGPGLQHLAIRCSDIFATLREMSMRSFMGGFEFMPKPNRKYYRDLPGRIGSSVLTSEQVKMCEELGILVDKDDQGVLLQIFTKPVGDRPTLFLEIIQRVGCMEEDGSQRGGCGGFGKGNFSALFKSIEDFEKTLDG